MKLKGEYDFEAPLGVVWNALFDPEVLARTLPGCDRLDREGDSFVGELNVKMGPVQGKFQGKVDVADVVEHESYTMVVDGRGPAGFVKATAQIALSEVDSVTRLAYDADAKVGGRIASVGQRLMDASAKAITKQSLEGLHAQVKVLAASESTAASSGSSDVTAADGVGAEGAEVVGEASGGAEPNGMVASASPGSRSEDSTAASPQKPAARKTATSTPAEGPSQTAFAMGVAREMTRELIPLRTIAWVVALLVVAFIAYRSLF